MQQSFASDFFCLNLSITQLSISKFKQNYFNSEIFLANLSNKLPELNAFVPNDVANICYENLLTYESLLYYPSSVLTKSDADTKLVLYYNFVFYYNYCFFRMLMRTTMILIIHFLVYRHQI